MASLIVNSEGILVAAIVNADGVLVELPLDTTAKVAGLHVDDDGNIVEAVVAAPGRRRRRRPHLPNLPNLPEYDENKHYRDPGTGEFAKKGKVTPGRLKGLLSDNAKARAEVMTDLREKLTDVHAGTLTEYAIAVRSGNKARAQQLAAKLRELSIGARPPRPGDDRNSWDAGNRALAKLIPETGRQVDIARPAFDTERTAPQPDSDGPRWLDRLRPKPKRPRNARDNEWTGDTRGGQVRWNDDGSIDVIEAHVTPMIGGTDQVSYSTYHFDADGNRHDGQLSPRGQELDAAAARGETPTAIEKPQLSIDRVMDLDADVRAERVREALADLPGILDAYERQRGKGEAKERAFLGRFLTPQNYDTVLDGQTDRPRPAPPGEQISATERRDYADRYVDSLDPAVRAAADEYGLEAHVIDGVISDDPDFAHLKGVKPRGWPNGKTWDDADGLYSQPKRKAVVTAKARPGTLSHEYGHGVDRLIGAARRDLERDDIPGYGGEPISDSPEFAKFARKVRSRNTNAYFRRNDELFAELWRIRTGPDDDREQAWQLVTGKKLTDEQKADILAEFDDIIRTGIPDAYTEPEVPEVDETPDLDVPDGLEDIDRPRPDGPAGLPLAGSTAVDDYLGSIDPTMRTLGDQHGIDVEFVDGKFSEHPDLAGFRGVDAADGLYQGGRIYVKRGSERGTLAHEYGHGLDNAVGAKATGVHDALASDTPEFKALARRIRTKQTDKYYRDNGELFAELWGLLTVQEDDDRRERSRWLAVTGDPEFDRERVLDDFRGLVGEWVPGAFDTEAPPDTGATPEIPDGFGPVLNDVQSITQVNVGDYITREGVGQGVVRSLGESSTRAPLYDVTFDDGTELSLHPYDVIGVRRPESDVPEVGTPEVDAPEVDERAWITATAERLRPDPDDASVEARFTRAALRDVDAALADDSPEGTDRASAALGVAIHASETGNTSAPPGLARQRMEAELGKPDIDVPDRRDLPEAPDVTEMSDTELAQRRRDLLADARGGRTGEVDLTDDDLRELNAVIDEETARTIERGDEGGFVDPRTDASRTEMDTPRPFEVPNGEMVETTPENIRDAARQQGKVRARVTDQGRMRRLTVGDETEVGYHDDDHGFVWVAKADGGRRKMLVRWERLGAVDGNSERGDRFASREELRASVDDGPSRLRVADNRLARTLGVRAGEYLDVEAIDGAYGEVVGQVTVTGADGNRRKVRVRWDRFDAISPDTPEPVDVTPEPVDVPDIDTPDTPEGDLVPKRPKRGRGARKARLNDLAASTDGEFTADELRAAEDRLIEAKVEAKEAARRRASEVEGTLDLLDANTLRLPPRKRRIINKATGAVSYRRGEGGGGGEWDWFDQLSEAEQRRLRRSRMVDNPDASGPDDLAERIRRNYAEMADWEDGAVLEWWTQRTAEHHAARAVASGRQPGGITPGMLADVWQSDDGLDPSIWFEHDGGDEIVAAARALRDTGAVVDEAEADHAYNELGDTVRAEPDDQPWAMDRELWVTVATGALNAVQNPDASDADWELLDQTIPASIQSMMTEDSDLDDIYDDIRALATTAGFDNLAPDSGRPGEPPDFTPGAPSPEPAPPEPQDYRGLHQPSYGPGVHEIDNGELLPPDVLDNPQWYTGYTQPEFIDETVTALRQANGDPDATVTIYRAVPPGVDELNPGDWVSLSRSYADQHGYGELEDDDWPVVSKVVPASEVRFAGDDLMEWGWFPDGDPDEPAPAPPGEDTRTMVRRLEADHPGLRLDIAEKRHGDGDYLELSRIVVPDDERNQGTGSAVMAEVLDHADREGLDVFLTPSSDFGGTKSRLERWYKSLGFESNKGRSRDYRSRETMVRRADSPQPAPPPPGNLFAEQPSLFDAPAEPIAPELPPGDDLPGVSYTIRRPTVDSITSRDLPPHRRGIGPEWVERAQAANPPEQLAIRVPASVLPKILGDGRIKNQFETGTSEGFYGRERRQQAETVGWGIPDDTPDADRLIYGYLEDVDEIGDVVGGYGGVVLRPKPEVAQRSTFTFGDSLHGTRKGELRPITLDEFDDLDANTALAAAGGSAYGDNIEVQYHGGLTVDDLNPVIEWAPHLDYDDLDELADVGAIARDQGWTLKVREPIGDYDERVDELDRLVRDLRADGVDVEYFRDGEMPDELPPEPDLSVPDPGDGTPHDRLDLPDPTWTDTPDGWTKVGEQSGSNPGARYRLDDPVAAGADLPAGSLFYVKHPESADHARTEVAANLLYEAAGVTVPQVHLGSDDSLVASRIVGTPETTQSLRAAADDPDAVEAIRRDFVVDAWLANWDVLGTAWDNVAIIDGQPVRLDAGGALTYRARGGSKGAGFGDTVGEIDSLRDPAINPVGARIFGDITDDELAEGAQRVANIEPDEIRRIVGLQGLDPDVADTLIARRQDLIDRYLTGSGDTTPEAPESADVPEGGTPDGPVAPRDPMVDDGTRQAAPYALVPQGVSEPWQPSLSSDGERFEARVAAVGDDPEQRMRVRVPVEAVEAILADGRLKTQFETGTSEGNYNPTERADLEQRKWGVPQEVDAAHRPVYGFLDDETGRFTSTTYGDVVFRVRPAAANRTTVSFGDSLSGGGVQATTVDEIRDADLETLHGATVIEFRPNSDYIEVQYHGGVSLDDVHTVAEVELPIEIAPAQATPVMQEGADRRAMERAAKAHDALRMLAGAGFAIEARPEPGLIAAARHNAANGNPTPERLQANWDSYYNRVRSLRAEGLNVTAVAPPDNIDRPDDLSDLLATVNPDNLPDRTPASGTVHYLSDDDALHAEIGRDTFTAPDRVRRYIKGEESSPEFLAALFPEGMDDLSDTSRADRLAKASTALREDYAGNLVEDESTRWFHRDLARLFPDRNLDTGLVDRLGPDDAANRARDAAAGERTADLSAVESVYFPAQHYPDMSRDLVLRESYESTQRWLQSLGYDPDDEIILYRGISGDQYHEWDAAGRPTTMRVAPSVALTTSRQTAEVYAFESGGAENGAVLQVRVRVGDIYGGGTGWTLPTELAVLGRDGELAVEAVADTTETLGGEFAPPTGGGAVPAV